MIRVFCWGDLLLGVNKYLIDWIKEDLPTDDFQDRISPVLINYVHHERNKAGATVHERVDVERVRLAKPT